nr:hypothetical protein [Tanacetum cinerariifolium]
IGYNCGYLLKRRKVLVVPGMPKLNLSRNVYLHMVVVNWKLVRCDVLDRYCSAAIMIEGYQLIYTCISYGFLEVAGSSHLQDRINLVFSGARSEGESFIRLMRDICFTFRMRLNKNHRLIAKLEALGQRRDVLRSLDYLREMVVRDCRTLGVLEQLLAGAHVGMRLKYGYVADMRQME